ncbi:MAG: bifunctional phosphoribosylaminoimidazolecarboxamide formyltransferase/IMP cyclohydrolase [Alphaproteobacteria bacterium]|nr:bifunctional phosphoribosylaminoimidazolecarboxamide formyltransferase/IMP cyclohydrolase [Alphaproteobacteria bacterium]
MVAADTIRVNRALISVSDKTGMAELGAFLAAAGVEILSTGGSARALAKAGVAVVEVGDYTGFPEMMDGRVKTLQPKIHGGILARRDTPEHLAAMEEHGIGQIDLVIVNLYPFEATVAKGAAFNDCIENIDIGGPALIRAAAKNHDFVAVVTDPAEYEELMAQMDTGATSLEFRRRLAGSAYARTAAYDAAVAGWFARQAGEALPPRMVLAGTRKQLLRYGENPHQQAAFYEDGSKAPGVASAQQVQGKALSYNNLNDTDAAFALVAEFERPSIAIIKHANPCGVASSDSLVDAYALALACDPLSAFGGIVACNRTIDAAAAEAITGIFTEVIIAPDAEEAARKIIAKKKNLRLLITGGMPDGERASMQFRTLAGGFLVQDSDISPQSAKTLKVVSKRAPSKNEIADMLFAFTVAKHVKSNAIVYVRDRRTVGIGAGQMSRIDSARIAAIKAGEAAREAGENGNRLEGSVVASDAFFPFADGLLAAAEAGATAVIQPGGSIRDDEVIAAADEHNLAMTFTGVRHFRH